MSARRNVRLNFMLHRISPYNSQSMVRYKPLATACGRFSRTRSVRVPATRFRRNSHHDDTIRAMLVTGTVVMTIHLQEPALGLDQSYRGLVQQSIATCCNIQQEIVARWP